MMNDETIRRERSIILEVVFQAVIHTHWSTILHVQKNNTPSSFGSFFVHDIGRKLTSSHL